jgi:hypothetical protein
MRFGYADAEASCALRQPRGAEAAELCSTLSAMENRRMLIGGGSGRRFMAWSPPDFLGEFSDGRAIESNFRESKSTTSRHRGVL